MGIVEDRLRRLSVGAKSAKTTWDDARDARDAAIADADAEGMPLRRIAAHTGIAVSHVQRIVTAQTARRQAQTADAVG